MSADVLPRFVDIPSTTIPTQPALILHEHGFSIPCHGPREALRKTSPAVRKDSSACELQILMVYKCKSHRIQSYGVCVYIYIC